MVTPVSTIVRVASTEPYVHRIRIGSVSEALRNRCGMPASTYVVSHWSAGARRRRSRRSRALEDHHALRAVVRVQRDPRARLEVRHAVEEHLGADGAGDQRDRARAAAAVQRRQLIGAQHRGRGLSVMFSSRPLSGGADPRVFTLTNSRMPCAPSSRPYPDRLMPPNGSRGSEATMPLTNTAPASMLRRQLGAPGRGRGPQRRAEAELGAVGQPDRLVGVAAAGDRGDRAERLLAEGGHRRGHVVEHRRRVEEAGPVDRAARRAAAWRPRRRVRRTWSCRVSRRSARASGPMSVSRLAGRRPQGARSATNAATNSSATLSSTMKRLALTQLWPVLMNRDLDGRRRGGGDVGVGQHDERVGAAQLEHLLLQRRAGLRGHDRADLGRAGQRHGRDPVVGDEPGDRAGIDQQRWTSPSGAPASRARSPRQPARSPGTLPACLSSAPLPAASAGAAKRKNCQNG